MTVCLRAHHLLCLLTYIGKGYSVEFITNCNRITDRLIQGEAILLVNGPDDLCAPLSKACLQTIASEREHNGKAKVLKALKGLKTLHCLQSSVLRRDEQAAAALTNVFGYAVIPGVQFVLEAGQLETMRTRFAQGMDRSACVGCEWFDLCTVVARSAIEKTRLQIKTKR